MSRPNVLGAIHAAFDADPDLALKVPGGLWTGEVPDKDPDTGDPIPKPYCRVDLEGTDYDWGLGELCLEHAKLCLTVVAVGGQACQEALDALEARFTFGDLDHPGSTARHVEMRPLRRDMRSDPVRDPDGNVLFVGVLLYEVQTLIPDQD